jgi:hypothetical protein
MIYEFVLFTRGINPDHPMFVHLLLIIWNMVYGNLLITRLIIIKHHAAIFWLKEISFI